MRVGFTGTRHGLTPSQAVAFAGVLPKGMTWFRHGCCVGADEDAVRIVDALDPRPSIFGAPSNIGALTSEFALAVSDDTTGEFSDPLERNRLIVDGSDLLVACPKGPEERRSGTWATVRYARKKGVPIVIVWPNGTVTGEGA